MIEKRTPLWAALCDEKGAEIKAIGRVRGVPAGKRDYYTFVWRDIPCAVDARKVKAAAFTSRDGDVRLGTVPMDEGAGPFAKGAAIRLTWRIQFEGSEKVH